MLAMTHQLDGVECRRRAALDDRRDSFDRHDFGLAVDELDEQAGELPELGAFGVGAATLGDFARGMSN